MTTYGLGPSQKLTDFLTECCTDSVELGQPKAQTINIHANRTIFVEREMSFVCDEPAKFDSNDSVSWLFYLVPAPCNEWRIMKHVREELSNPLEGEGVSVMQETWTSFPADLHAKMI